MGHSYSAAGRLCCDGCDTDRGVRARTCPHKVFYAEGGELPYCYPPDLCADCYAKHKAEIHKDCAAGALKRSQEEQLKRERLMAGDVSVKAAWGSWCHNQTVPDGFVGVMFENRLKHEQVYRLVPKDDYDPTAKHFLSDYPTNHAWTGPNATTKEAR